MYAARGVSLPSTRARRVSSGPTPVEQRTVVMLCDADACGFGSTEMAATSWCEGEDCAALELSTEPCTASLLGDIIAE